MLVEDDESISMVVSIAVMVKVAVQPYVRSCYPYFRSLRCATSATGRCILLSSAGTQCVKNMNNTSHFQIYLCASIYDELWV